MFKGIHSTIATLLLSASVLYAQNQNPFLVAMYTENWQKAITVQEAVCKAKPQSLLDWMYLADAYNAGSRPLDARKALQKAGTYAGKTPYAAIVEGRIALIDERPEEALRALEKAGKAGKKDVTALRLIGESWLYGRHRDLARAESSLLTAQRRDNRDFRTHLDLGYCYIQLNNGGEALLQFDRAQALRPDSPLPAFLAAMTYKNAKIPTKRLEYLDKALALDPNFAEALRQKAELFYYGRRDFATAATLYARLLELDRNAPVTDKMAYVNSLFLTKQYDETIAWVDKIIAEDSSHNYLRRLSAYALYETGKFEPGLAMLDDYFARVDTAKIIPEDYEYYAKFMQQDQQDSLAAVYYEKAITLDPGRWEWYADIGSIRYKSGDYAGAALAYDRRLDSLDTRTALDYYQAGLAYYMLRDSVSYGRAAEYFTKVSDIVPDKTTGWLMLARTLSKLEPDVETYPERTAEFGKAKEAFEHFVAIAEVQPDKYKSDLVSAYEYLAYYYILQKEETAVRQYLEKLSMLDPENETAAGIGEWLRTEQAQED